MNNKLLFVSNAVLVIAVLVLFYLQFNNPKAPKSVADELENQSENLVTDSLEIDSEIDFDTASIGEISFPKAKIVFINTDTLYRKYEYFKKVTSQLESKQSRSESDLYSRSQALEKEFATAQQMAATMTRSQLEETEQKFMKKQQDLMEYKDKLTEEMMREEEKTLSTLRKKINDYLQQLALEQGYEYILSYSSANPVFYGSKKYDITNEVVKSLNATYKKEQTK